MQCDSFKVSKCRVQRERGAWGVGCTGSGVHRELRAVQWVNQQEPGAWVVLPTGAACWLAEQGEC